MAKAALVQANWRRTPPETRRDILNRLADLLEANKTELAHMAALDGGTTLMVGERGVTPAASANSTKYMHGQPVADFGQAAVRHGFKIADINILSTLPAKLSVWHLAHPERCC